MSETRPILLFDGVCGLCNGFVQWVLAHERDVSLLFSPLQGETAVLLRERHPEIPRTLESVVLVEGGRVYLRSAAALRVASHLAYPWCLASLLRFTPAALLDLGYRAVARVRYRIFGRLDACLVPSAAQRARFLP